MIGSSKFGRNSPIEDRVKAVGLQVNVRSPIARLVLGGGGKGLVVKIYSLEYKYNK